MTPERWYQIKNICGALLECAPERRQALQEELCAGDDELKQEVAAMLAQSDSSGSVLDPQLKEKLGIALSMSGRQFSHYRILEHIGSGGMGEVYRARDTKLGRDVALKLLPNLFDGDQSRLARFKREAQLLASLNHPHIAAIYGVEESDQQPALVLELVDGATLADHIAKGPKGIEETLRIAIQIAEALEAAHDKSVIHRDLKPANVKITTQGTVKVLDFGLAKVLDDESAQASSKSQSSAAGTPTTELGMILGTAGYMSPEQARGNAVDRRTDIWAFGVIVFEMLTGRRAFVGETVADTLGKILEREPDWSRLPENTPRSIRTLLRRCLEKDRGRRLHHIADAKIEILDALAGIDDAPATASGKTSRLLWLGAIGAAMAGALVSAVLLSYRGTPPPSEMRVEVSTSATSKSEVAISPDRRFLAFSVTKGQETELWIRPLESTSASPVTAARNSTGQPLWTFWSPDSRSIGFFADGKLKRVELEGGPSQIIADAPNSRGGAWGRDGSIVLSLNLDGPLYRTSAAGGGTTPVTHLEEGQNSHRYPEFLPDGRHFLYYALGKHGVTGVYVASLDGGGQKRVLEADSKAVFANPGFLVFLRQGTLLAQRFDLKKLAVTGEPLPLAEHVNPVEGFTSSAAISTSDDGTVAFRSMVETTSRLVWFDRAGNRIKSYEPAANWANVALSPDGNRAAVQKIVNGNADIWVVDFTRDGVATRVTTHEADEEAPVWSPDGRQIVFSSNRNGFWDLYSISPGGGPESVLLETAESKTPKSWSADGRYILYTVQRSKGNDLDALPVGGGGKPFPVANSDFMEDDGVLSRDGLVAYESKESGQNEVYVQSFPKAKGRVRISTAGGGFAQWRADGKELFFLDRDNNLISVPISISNDGAVIPGKQNVLFHMALLPNTQPFSVTPDGKRFLMIVPTETNTPPIQLFFNWVKRFGN